MLLKEGMCFQATTRVLGGNFRFVKQWFKNKSGLVKQIHDARKEGCEIDDVELDELCHFVKKKTQSMDMVSDESFDKTSDRF